MKVDQMMKMKEERQVLKIPAVSPIGKITEEKKQTLCVAAYCRVSTELDQQAGSYARQMSYYREKIDKKEGWILAGIYADDRDIIGLNQKTF